MELHGIFLAYLSLILYSTPISSLAMKTVPQHQPSLISSNTTRFNASDDLTIGENVAQLLAMISRTPEREYRKATLFNVQIMVDRTGRPSNQIADFRSIACWFRSGATHPGLPLYNAFIMQNGAPRHWDRWKGPEPFWVDPNWGKTFSSSAIVTTFLILNSYMKEESTLTRFELLLDAYTLQHWRRY